MVLNIFCRALHGLHLLVKHNYVQKDNWHFVLLPHIEWSLTQCTTVALLETFTMQDAFCVPKPEGIFKLLKH